jgi:hypothetical protein
METGSLPWWNGFRNRPAQVLINAVLIRDDSELSASGQCLSRPKKERAPHSLPFETWETTNLNRPFHGAARQSLADRLGLRSRR